MATALKERVFRGRLPGIEGFDAGALACADCEAPCSLASLTAWDVRGLHADVKDGRRKVLCGGCIRGGPVVVTMVEVTPPPEVEPAREADDEDDGPAPGVSFAKACVVAGIDEPKRSSDRKAVRALLSARGWTAAQPEGAGRVLWYQPARMKRRPGKGARYEQGQGSV